VNGKLSNIGECELICDPRTEKGQLGERGLHPVDQRERARVHCFALGNVALVAVLNLKINVFVIFVKITLKMLGYISGFRFATARRAEPAATRTAWDLVLHSLTNV
jgi:hypothetical protein